MIRRSRRNPAPRAASIDQVLSDASEFLDDEVEVVEKNPRGRKRKTYDRNDTKGDGQPQAKKVRGKRGLLKHLVEMPVDVLFEIFGSLEPLDLIHLTRTSKDLRALLLSRSSISTWKQSLANISGLPDCPDDLTEPQYAELVFGKCCHICNKNAGTIQTMWGARVRACSKCFETNDRFMETREYYSYSVYGPELYKLLPMVEVARRSGRYNRVKYFADATLDSSWRSEYAKLQSSPSEQKEWLANKIQEMTVVHKHATACSAWLVDVHNRREADKQTVIDNRKALVVKRLRDMGWGEELDRQDEYSDRPENHITVVKACQKDLTEKVLLSLEAPLTEFMEAKKSRRLREERRELLKERMPALNNVRETCVSTLPANAIYPTTADLFRIPFVRNIIDTVPAGAFTSKDLEPIGLAFDVLNHQWQKDMELKLLDLIQAAQGSDVQDSVDTEAVLNLATSFFSCGKGGCYRFLRYPAILMHSCARKYNYGELNKDDLDQFFIAENLKQTSWNASLNISMKPEHVAVISQLLDMVALDPKTATVQEMDTLDPIFECIFCNSLTEGRAIMNWQTALVHLTKRHGLNSGIKLVLLDENESQALRPRMIEQLERERHRDYTYSDCMICVICKKTGRRMNLREHIRKDHGRPNPAEEDVVLNIEANRIPDVYRHWPPREESDKPTTV